MTYYLFYKHKVCGPYTEMTEKWINLWKLMVDTGLMRELPDTDFLNEDMRNHPDEVHVIVNSKEKVMKAKLVLHHDDPPCTVKLQNGYCPVCELTPDMQSTCFYYYCPNCDVKLDEMVCPICKKKYEKK